MRSSLAMTVALATVHAAAMFATPSLALEANARSTTAMHGSVDIDDHEDGGVIVHARAVVKRGSYALNVSGPGRFTGTVSICAPEHPARTCAVTLERRVAEPGEYRVTLMAGRRVLERASFTLKPTSPPSQAAAMQSVPAGPDARSAPAAPTSSEPTPPTAAPAASVGWQADMLVRVNGVRAGVGAPALQLCAAACLAAQRHAEDMASRNYFSHYSPERTDPGSRLAAAGLVAMGWGENIAAGYPDVAAVVQGWVDSPGHYQNLVNPSFTHVGFGLADGPGSFGRYWVQTFSGNC